MLLFGVVALVPILCIAIILLDDGRGAAHDCAELSCSSRFWKAVRHAATSSEHGYADPCRASFELAGFCVGFDGNCVGDMLLLLLFALTILKPAAAVHQSEFDFLSPLAKLRGKAQADAANSKGAWFDVRSRLVSGTPLADPTNRAKRSYLDMRSRIRQGGGKKVCIENGDVGAEKARGKSTAEDTLSPIAKIRARADAANKAQADAANSKGAWFDVRSRLVSGTPLADPTNRAKRSYLDMRSRIRQGGGKKVCIENGDVGAEKARGKSTAEDTLSPIAKIRARADAQASTDVAPHSNGPHVNTEHVVHRATHSNTEKESEHKKNQARSSIDVNQALHWNEYDAAKWVSAIAEAYTKYSPLFIRHGVCGEDLLSAEFSDADLREIGIDSNFHRRRILREVKKLQQQGKQEQ